MTIRHCVLLRMREALDPRAVEGLVEALRALPGQIPQIRGYEVGVDLGWRQGNPDVAVVATFDDEAGWRAYVEHPAHVAVVEEHIDPFVAERTSVQFEI